MSVSDTLSAFTRSPPYIWTFAKDGVAAEEEEFISPTVVVTPTRTGFTIPVVGLVEVIFPGSD